MELVIFLLVGFVLDINTGVIIQWLRVVNPVDYFGTTLLNFPTTFTTSCCAAIANALSESNFTSNGNVQFTAYSLSCFYTLTNTQIGINRYGTRTIIIIGF